MKPNPQSRHLKLKMSPPARGAWIETRSRLKRNRNGWVAPRAGGVD